MWLPGFFNPQSFLTAIMQSTARKNELPLDKMCLTCEVTKRNCGEVQQTQREGAYIHGLFMEVNLVLVFTAQWSLYPTTRERGGT